MKVHSSGLITCDIVKVHTSGLITWNRTVHVKQKNNNSEVVQRGTDLLRTESLFFNKTHNQRVYNSVIPLKRVSMLVHMIQKRNAIIIININSIVNSKQRFYRPLICFLQTRNIQGSCVVSVVVDYWTQKFKTPWNAIMLCWHNAIILLPSFIRPVTSGVFGVVLFGKSALFASLDMEPKPSLR